MKIRKLIATTLFAGIAFGSPAAFAVDDARLSEHCDIGFHGTYSACQASVNAILGVNGLPGMILGETVAAYMLRNSIPAWRKDTINAFSEYCGGKPTEVTPPTSPVTYYMGGGSDGHNCN